jgi:hypothetical protein
MAGVTMNLYSRINHGWTAPLGVDQHIGLWHIRRMQKPTTYPVHQRQGHWGIAVTAGDSDASQGDSGA